MSPGVLGRKAEQGVVVGVEDDGAVVGEGDVVGDEMEEQGGLNGGDVAGWSRVDALGCGRQRGGSSCTSSPSIMSSQLDSND
jgi:hypothetical protein